MTLYEIIQWWPGWVIAPAILLHSFGQSMFQGKNAFKIWHSLSEDHNTMGHHLVQTISFESWGQQILNFRNMFRSIPSYLSAFKFISIKIGPINRLPKISARTFTWYWVFASRFQWDYISLRYRPTIMAIRVASFTKNYVV